MAEFVPQSTSPVAMEKESDLEVIGHSARKLSEEEIHKLQKDQYLVSEFKQRKYEIEARKNWDLFYKRNTTKFFKDRHWTKREFSELFENIGGEVCTNICKQDHIRLLKLFYKFNRRYFCCTYNISIKLF